MAIATAGIGEALPCLGNELPVVAAGLEGELQDAEGCGIAHFAVGFCFPEGAVILAAGAHDEFANAARGICSAIRRLRGEALVIVIVAGDHDVGVGFVESLEKRLNGEIVAVGATGTEERLVPVGEGAGGGMGREIGAQPFFLRRSGFAAADILTFAVEHDDVPGSEFVAVVTGLLVARSCSEIVEIGCRTSGMKLMIARGRPRAGFYATPGLVVADEILFRAIGIGQVADSHDGAGELDKQFCRGFGASKIFAISDVTRANQDCRLIVGRVCA